MKMNSVNYSIIHANLTGKSKNKLIKRTCKRKHELDKKVKAEVNHNESLHFLVKSY